MTGKDMAWQWLNDRNVYSGEMEGHTFLIVHDWETVETPEFPEILSLTTGYNEEEHAFPDDFWGFSDEYDTCSECNHVIRTSPDSYSWVPDFWESDYGRICGDCVRSDPDDYIEERVEMGKRGKAVGCYLVNPTDHNFTLVLSGLENGLHHGQNDNPLAISRWTNEHDLVVLYTVSPSQFTVSFDVYFAGVDNGEYIPLSEVSIEGIRNALVESETRYSVTLRREFRQWPSPAENAERALKSLSKPYARIDVSMGEVKEYDTIEEYMRNV